MEKDTKSNETAVAAAVIDTNNVQSKTSPIVIKIEAPKEAIKKHHDDQKSIDDVKKEAKSKFCQLLPILLFLVTFATVLTLLIIYLDPSSEYLAIIVNGNLHSAPLHQNYDDNDD